MTAQVFRHISGPGSGKTHTLLTFVSQEQEQGLALRDLTFCSFTRSQRDDIRVRIGALFPDATAKEIRKQVKTVHGVALTDCLRHGLIPELSRKDSPIITEGANPQPFERFCREYGLDYTRQRGHSKPDEESGALDKMPVGNAIFALSRYIRQQYVWGPENWTAAMDALGMNHPPDVSNVAGYIRAWEAFKQENSYYEHDDYVALAIDRQALPTSRVIFIDEFQDLSPLQYQLFCQWCDSAVERIYIAGDPNQAIYGFRGADPAFLALTPATDRGEKPVSHRCPAEIVAVADAVLGSPSNMEPKGPGGVVASFYPHMAEEFVRSVRAVCDRYGGVLILSRFRTYVWDLANALSAAGIPVTGLTPGAVYGWERVTAGEDNTRIPMPVLLGLLRRIDDYDSDATCFAATRQEAATLITASTLGEERKQAILRKLKVSGSVLFADLLSLFGISADTSRRPAAALVGHLALSEKLKRNLVRALDNRILPGRIRVDTIHAAKGLEAPAVILHAGYLLSRCDGYFQQNALSEKKRAEERRVYYVGCTRASEALFFMDGLSDARAPALDGVIG